MVGAIRSEARREPGERRGIGTVVVLPPLGTHMESARECVLPVPAMAPDHVAAFPMAQEREVRDLQAKHPLAVIGIHEVGNSLLPQKSGMILQQSFHQVLHNPLERSSGSMSGHYADSFPGMQGVGVHLDSIRLRRPPVGKGTGRVRLGVGVGVGVHRIPYGCTGHLPPRRWPVRHAIWAARGRRGRGARDFGWSQYWLLLRPDPR